MLSKNNKKMGIRMELRQKQKMSPGIIVAAGVSSLIAVTACLMIFFNFSGGDTQASAIENSGLAMAGDFRTINSGEWNDPGIWETFDGQEWKSAEMYPVSTDGMITVGGGHDVNLTSDEIIDELHVSGALTLSTKRIMLLDGDITVTGSLNVNGRLMAGTSVISGKGAFSLGTGATLLIGSPKGITLSANAGNIQTAGRSYSSYANYVYCGTEAQVTGDGLPAGELNGTLTLDNEKGCSLSSNVTINNQLLLQEGVLCLNGKTLTVNTQKIVSRSGGTLNLCGGSIAGDLTNETGMLISMDQFINSLAAENTQQADASIK